MKNTIVAFLSVIFILAVISDANAQKRSDMRQNFNRMHEQLNLTDQQKAKMEELRLKHQEQMIDMRAELEKARLENQKLRSSDNLNRSDVISQTKKMNNIKNKMAESRANHKMDVYELLTDEQRKIWNDLKYDKPRFKDGRKKGNHGKGYRDRSNRF